jgi:hypothetical protein
MASIHGEKEGRLILKKIRVAVGPGQISISLGANRWRSKR